jgi:uncharacterized protein (UPF0335 family)
MNIDKKALKGVVDEIEASRTRQKGETEFQREALKRAVKNHQLDAKAIRIVLQRRAMGDTKRDEQDYYVHSYELALGGKKDALEALERGATVREAAAVGGISTGAAGNLAKTVQKSSFVDSETGEITQTAPDTPGEGAAAEPPDDGDSALATTNGQEAPDALEGGEAGRAEPSPGVPANGGEGHCERPSPQPDAYSTGAASMQHEMGAVGSPEGDRVARHNTDDWPVMPTRLRREKAST